MGQLADRGLLSFECGERLLALRSHPFGHAAGQAVLGRGRRPLERAAARQHHLRDRGERGAVVVGGPLDQPPERRAQRRHGQDFDQRAHMCVWVEFDRDETFRFNFGTRF